MDNYIKVIPNADLIYHLTSGWPLLLWILFGHNLSKHIIKPNSLLGKKVSKTISFPLKIFTCNRIFNLDDSICFLF